MTVHRDVVLSVPQLHGFTKQMFQAFGMVPEHAGIMADQLTWAHVRGYPWIGARKIIQYGKRIRNGVTYAIGEPKVVSESESFVLLDGGDTFNHISGFQAMSRAIEKARDTGVCAALVRNVTSASAMGYFVNLAIRECMIGVAITNAPPLMAPFGSKAKLIGNQAFAIGSPAGKHDPIIFDTALSELTLVAIHGYEVRGECLPENVALDASGAPTVDPAAALAGILLPIAGHRGSGLAIMWEILTGILSGADRFMSDVTMPDVFDRPQAVSTFFLAIDPRMSIPYEIFVDRVDNMIERIHNAPPAEGFDHVRVPGESSAERARNAEESGVAISDSLVRELKILAREFGVSWP